MAPRPWDDLVARANADARQPILFLPGPPRSAPVVWTRWAETFGEAGYVALIPEWPLGQGAGASADDVAQAAAHFALLARALSSRPAIVGYGVAGRVAEALGLDGVSAATVVILSRPPTQAGPQKIEPSPERAGPLLVTLDTGDAFTRPVAEQALAFIQRFV